MEAEFDAVIIGAGPAGSSAAILLARAGWRVAVIEKHAFPRRKVCGECIAASNLPLFDALGVSHTFAELAGPPLRQVALLCSDHRMIRASLPPFSDPHRQWGRALGREHLDTLLLNQARACGADVFQPWQVVGVQGTPGRIRCHARAIDSREERVLSAQLLIDAHGSWEPLAPHHARHHYPCLPSDLFAFKTNFADTTLEHGVLPVLSFQGGYGGIVIGDHGMATLAFCLRRDALEQARARISDIGAPEAAAQWVVDHCKELPAMLAGATRRGKWLGSGPLRPGIRITQAPGTAFRIGNAAGEAHPIIGEGISMAVQSAALLANMLVPYKMDIAAAQVQERLQAHYAKAWCRYFSRRIRLAALFAHAAMRPKTYGSLLPLLARYPALLGHFARWCDKVRPGPDAYGGCQLQDINNGEAPTR